MRGAIAVVVEDHTIGIAHQGRILWEGPHNVRLDYTNSFGRHCAREWLGEQGHPTTEDRAEVLAWSVVSVSRGGKPIAGVAGAWVQPKNGKERNCWMRQRPNASDDTPVLGVVEDPKPEWQEEGGWMVQPLGMFSRRNVPHGDETGEAGKAACDAALLRLGWALTNDDGTLTLPPLPELPNAKLAS